MSLHPDTVAQLQSLLRRKKYYSTGPRTDEAEVGKINERINNVLDTRPRVHSVAPDGEVLFDNASPMVLEQGLPLAVNITGVPEEILAPPQYQELRRRWRDHGGEDGTDPGLIPA